MTTIDLDGIRKRYEKLESFADQEATGLRGMAYNTAVALAANLSAADIPAVLDEIERLRGEREHMELNPTGTAEWLKHRVAELTAELDKVRAQLTDAETAEVAR